MPIQGETTGSRELNGWMDFPTMRSILLSKFGESNSLPIIGSFSDSSVHRIDPCMPYGTLTLPIWSKASNHLSIIGAPMQKLLRRPWLDLLKVCYST
jgi:hypothetical protein